ncbi:MAG: deoxyguanosinetriphosphate triphosphohydrolase [Dehalococcoidales bacterium]|nr:MAG: deoxyguanosinetriphosphate triphosphohydrolase [Dehalococcoidales bacterium]
MNEQLNIRQLTEEREESLSPFAQKSRLSRGRREYEEPCPVRTDFQRDRDRILYSNAFRRLKHKTQVFIAPLGDHYVTRLTHTLEVSQIARTIARALNLNEDLAEAISLGHDLGHTPFGHIGEAVLDEISPHGFRHNEQSLRIVERLERNGRGLNLTWEVRDGILSHSKTNSSILPEHYERASTIEGEICRLADVIAYVNHDTEDAIRAGAITEGDLPLSAVTVLGLSNSARINTMVNDIIGQSWAASGSETPDTASGVHITMSPEVLEATNIFREFLFNRVYDVRSSQHESEQAREIIRLLYKYFTTNENKLPPEYRLGDDDRERRVVDHIAGMTDRYALRTAEEMSLLDNRIKQPPLLID